MGIRCRDANNRIVADVGDYNCRFLGTGRATVPSMALKTSVGFNGCTEGGSFAIVVAVDGRAGRWEPAFFSARCRNGSVDIINQWQRAAAMTVTFQVYSFT